MTNKLFYGDNLDVLREHVASESVGPGYLEPASVERAEREEIGRQERLI